MPTPRVQVRDLSPPEKIQPAPVQSDTFAAAAPPPIDNNLERLASALGHFGAGIRAYASGRAREEEENLKLQHLSEYEQWKAALSPQNQLEAIRTGKVTYHADPLIADIVKRDYAMLEAEALAQDIDNEVVAGIAPFGKVNFDADAYVREKAASYVDRISRDPRTMIYFGNALDKVRASVTEKHQRALGAVQTQLIEDRASRELKNAIIQGIKDGGDPQRITDGLREIYKFAGPRLKKGSLDLSYSRIDELALDVLHDLAQNPEYVAVVEKMLGAQRVGVDGETRLGSLADVERHRDKVNSIILTATKTKADFADRAVTGQTIAAAQQALMAQDGTFSTVMDLNKPNPFDPTKSIKLSADQIKEQAVRGWLDAIRAKNNGQPNFEEEFGVLMANGLKHPEYGALFDTGFKGFLNQLVKSGEAAPDQLAKITELADLYSKVADRNWAYAQSHMSKDTAEFFETYRVLTRFAGRTPEAAAAELSMLYSSKQANTDPNIESRRARQVAEKIGQIDLSRWPLFGDPANRWAIEPYITSVANTLAKVEGVDVDEAINRAINHITSTSAVVNNRLVIDPGLKAEDVPNVQALLDRTFKDNAARFKELGIDDATHLSIAPRGQGQFLVMKWNGGAVTVPVKDKEGKVIGTRPVILTINDIQHVRSKMKEEADKKAVERARKSFQGDYSDYAPHNLLRGIFGQEPVP